MASSRILAFLLFGCVASVSAQTSPRPQQSPPVRQQVPRTTPQRTAQVRPQPGQTPTRNLQRQPASVGRQNANQQRPSQQRPSQQRPGPGQQAAAQPVMVKAAPFRLTPTQQQRVDQILTFWEHRSSKVQTYTTKFTRFEYDPVFGPKDSRIAKSRGGGIIRYSAPDKGEFKLETEGVYTVAAGAKSQYPQKPIQFDEHWICDGNSIYEFNSKTKQLMETRLPEEMRGKQIADGPLPFMFGATKAKLNARYWIRELKPPTENKGQYWLEVYPKLHEDQMNFSRVRVILDEKHFLPQGLEIFPPGWDAEKNWGRTAYMFADRQVNNPVDRGRQFLDRFISPKPPLGWKKVVNNFGQPAAPAGPQNAQRQRPRRNTTK